MRNFSPPKRNLGLTVAEVLISSAMMLLLSSIFFTAVIPALSREKWFQDKQTNVTGYLVAREHLVELLPHCLLVPEAERSVVGTPDILLLEFYKQEEVQTESFASLATIDLRESVIYDETKRFQIRLTSDGKLIETDELLSYKKLIWNLGEGAIVTSKQASDLRQVDFSLDGVLEPNTPRSLKWHRDIIIRFQ